MVLLGELHAKNSSYNGRSCAWMILSNKMCFVSVWPPIETALDGYKSKLPDRCFATVRNTTVPLVRIIDYPPRVARGGQGGLYLWLYLVI